MKVAPKQIQNNCEGQVSVTLNFILCYYYIFNLSYSKLTNSTFNFRLGIMNFELLKDKVTKFF